MAKRIKHTERSYDNPNLSWECDGTIVKVFFLEKNEYIKTYASTNYDFTASGPTLFVEKMYSWGSREFNELDINDAKFWKWISRLMQTGVASFGGTVTSLKESF